MRALLKNTTLRAAVALPVLLACVCLLSACGGSSEDAQSLLNDTFSGHTQIESGDVNLSFAISAAGSSATTKPLAVRLSGPFQDAGAGKLPRFALQLDLSAAGHALRAGATSTGSAFYVELAGTWFSTPESTFRAIEEGYAQATKTASTAKARSTFASLGIEPGHWLSSPAKVGAVTIAGVQTVHLTASVNVSGLLADVSRLSQSSGALGLGSAVPGAGALSPAAISELAKSVKSAHVDIYIGQSDHLLRRLEVSATVSGTPQTQGLLGGLSTADVKVLLEFSSLNKPQAIAAPSNPQPSSQLLPALQQLVGLLQGVGGSSSSSVR
ncbi:MAG TPA: hypothetical protein VFV03_05790 [Solirubrobacteraceae bacterium]|nr:hypothetical protein [Solirubrobacteraceae bacterium]